jgi:hypothetical protein
MLAARPRRCTAPCAQAKVARAACTGAPPASTGRSTSSPPRAPSRQEWSTASSWRRWRLGSSKIPMIQTSATKVSGSECQVCSRWPSATGPTRLGATALPTWPVHRWRRPRSSPCWDIRDTCCFPRSSTRGRGKHAGQSSGPPAQSGCSASGATTTHLGRGSGRSYSGCTRAVTSALRTGSSETCTCCGGAGRCFLPTSVTRSSVGRSRRYRGSRSSRMAGRTGPAWQAAR